MDSNIKAVQLKELDLFKRFLSFCNENNITYYAVGGTLLGAVRHKGFIPWDDDMDVAMPRGDYERFLVLCQKKKPPFELYTFENDENHYTYTAIIGDSSIKLKLNYGNTTVVQPAWVDIFPLDGMPGSKFTRKLYAYFIMYRRAMYTYSCFNVLAKTTKQGRPFIERCLMKIGTIVPVEKLLNTEKEYRKLDKTLKRYSYEESDYIINALGAYKFREIVPKKYFGDGTFYEFEDIQIRGPKEYHGYLTQIYGDYMVPISEDSRNHHCSEVVDG